MNNPPARPVDLKVFAYEVSCLIIAANDIEADRALHDMLIDSARYWIDQGAPISEQETLEVLRAHAAQAPAPSDTQTGLLRD